MRVLFWVMRVLRWVVERLEAGRRWARDYKLWRGLLATLGMALIVGLLVAIYGPLGDWAGGPAVRDITPAKDKAAAINTVRQTLLATAAGLAAITGLAFTGRTFYLSRRGQLTDRYTKAIAQLASDKLEERLGGIYALEHLMLESARDHQTVVDVLAAFVREHASAAESLPAPAGPIGAEAVSDQNAHQTPRREPVADVEAALTVLGRRPRRREPHRLNLRRTDLVGAGLYMARLQGANLSGARLQGADLRWARLKDAFLFQADLQGAVLFRADLQGADLRGAQLQGADLRGAQLQGANLREAQLQGANLREADLQYTNLRGADLQGAGLGGVDLRGMGLGGVDLRGMGLGEAHLHRADLREANLQDAQDLTADQVRATIYDATTRLDPALRATLADAEPTGPSDPTA